MTRPGTGDLDTPYDLLVRGGIVVSPESAVRRDVAVRDGRIAALAEPGTLRRAHRVVDATGRYVLPGLVDAHVHFRTPA
ncbi:hypothetical protein [Actinoplanes sp. CA-252034]|uniref:hypothetical protein n=1 Tax=Actinoplanes sp. CA-252034 TaxID=3239906 RepID=UPI003D967260